MASLAWDLAERLKFGIALGLVPYRAFDTHLEDDPNLRGGWIGWSARDKFLEREGSYPGENSQPLVDHFLQGKDRLPAEHLTYMEHLKKHHRQDYDFFGELQTEMQAAWEKRWGFMLASTSDAAGSIDVESIFCGRNSMLDEGSPYYLRNTDYEWYADFSHRVKNRCSIKAMSRWLSLRDRTNNLIAAEQAEKFQKIDHHYTELLRGNYESCIGNVEIYRLGKKEATPHKISGARGTCRSQDEYVLRWFEKKGLRVNPYTRWLDHLMQISEKSSAAVAWNYVRIKAAKYVPPNMGENDEQRLAQLYWCLSRPNPGRYPYRFRFSSRNKTKGESLLRAWWEQVRQDAGPTG